MDWFQPIGENLKVKWFPEHVTQKIDSTEYVLKKMKNEGDIQISKEEK